MKTLQDYDSIWELILIPDNKLASGQGNNSISIWDMITSQRICSFKEHTSSIMCFCFSQKGQLISGSRNGSIKVWDISKDKSIVTLNHL